MLPEAGDIAWIEFDPVKGTERAGRRPGLILSSVDYHQKSGRAVVCPISSNVRQWPFNVTLPSGLKTVGVVMVDQIRAIERGARIFAIIEHAPSDLMSEVRGRLAALLGFDFMSPPVRMD